MRRTFSILMMLSSLSLLAATPAPKPTPVPQSLVTPTPAPTFNPLGVKVTVVIFPFQAPADVDPKTGGNIATIYQTVLTQQGGMTILPIPKDVKREDYGKYAKAQKADYYVSGYLQPIGQGAAIVASVVDVSSETAIYSATTQIESVQDVASQALNARSVIAQASGIERLQHITTTTTTPTPSSNEGTSISLTNALGGLFKGKGKAKGTPAPTPTPAKPSRAVIVNHLIGNAQSSDEDAATADLTLSLNRYFNASILKSPVTNIATSADSICGTNRNSVIAGGVLNATRQGQFHAYYTYSFKLDIYTCFGALYYSGTASDTNRAKAIQTAVDDYQKAHPNN